MKKYITAIIYGIIGLLLIVGPHTIFKVCSTDKMVMKCHYSIVAVAGTGGLLIVIGVLTIWAKTYGEKLRLSLVSIATAFVSILFPAVLIGGCGDAMMACRSVTFPSIYILNALVILYSVVQILLGERQLRNSVFHIPESETSEVEK